MRLFVHLSRETGLSWLASDEAGPSTSGARTCDAASRAPGPGEFRALNEAAAKCSALVAWGAVKQVAALVRASARAGVGTGALEEAALVEMGELFPAEDASLCADASALAARYYRADEAAGLLPPGCAPSQEQWATMRAFEQGHNVVCRAVAGAGKTTTLLLCARRCPKKSCLLLTYNKRLQLEVARRAGPKGAALANVQVLTYHAAAGRAYGCVVQNDEAFRRVVAAAPEQPPRFGVLMIDEAQDMAVEYYALARHLLRANPEAQLVVVGDELQAINEYRGARPEFLSEAPALYAGLAADRPWAACRLSVSQRLTPATAAFVNAHLYGAPVIVGGNRRDPDRRPLYYAARTKEGVAQALAAAVAAAVAEYGPEGVFVLAPSVRNLSSGRTPLADLVRRHLTGVPTYVAGQDDARVDADLVRGKLAVLSFNAVKGCERPCVVLVGLDETYFDYYERGWEDPAAVPNVLTVAATRAEARLVVVANSLRTLRTVCHARLAVDAEVRASARDTPARPKPRAPPPQRERPLAVSELVRHLHPETVRAAMERVVVLPAGGPLAAALAGLPPAQAAPSKVRFGGYYEDLGFVYGVVAPVLAELARSGETAFGEGLEAPTIVADGAAVRPFSADITAAEYAAYPTLFWEQVSEAAFTPGEARTPAEWGRLAVARHALEGGHHHIARQVPDYDWVRGEALAAARDTILHVLEGVAGAFEVRLPSVAVGPRLIVGRADFIEAGPGGVLWEFKNASEYCEEHALQLAAYLALRGGGEGVLLSVLRREAWSVSVAPEDAAPLLWALAYKVREPTVSIYALIERFDRGQSLGESLGDAGTEKETSVGWALDDLY